jgi:hypothetical protein
MSLNGFFEKFSKRSIILVAVGVSTLKGTSINKKQLKPDKENFGLSINNSVGHATCNGNIKNDFNEEQKFRNLIPFVHRHEKKRLLKTTSSSVMIRLLNR